MKKTLVEILACPICKGELKLTIREDDGAEIVSGELHCAKCNEHYPIEDGIPNMLPPDMRE